MKNSVEDLFKKAKIESTGLDSDIVRETDILRQELARARQELLQVKSERDYWKGKAEGLIEGITEGARMVVARGKEGSTK